MIHLPHLETNVFIGCQNRCIACNHFVPLQVDRVKGSMVMPADLAEDLAAFGRLAHVEGYALIGGEPTLHPLLVDLMRVARQSGIADHVEVWTNGQTLRRMADTHPGFWDEADRLVVSVYPGKLTDEDLDEIRALSRDAGVELVIKDERLQPNFTVLLEPEPTSELVTRRKYKDCWFKSYSRVLDRGVLYRCCTSPFIGPLLQGRPEGADGIPLAGLTEEALATFLARAEPMPSCAICAGRNTASARPIPWSEIRDPDSWVRASAGAMV